MGDHPGPRLSIRTKLVVALCAFGVLPVVAAGGYGAIQAFALLRDSVQQRLQTEVLIQARSIQRLLRDVAEDALFLSRLPTLRALVELPADELAGGHPLARPVGEALRSFARSRPLYYQLRYLDHRGREVVRVDAGVPEPGVVDPAGLQDKADRYYFREAMAAPPETVYASPMDLNVEHGVVERPLIPVVRYAVPIRNTRGEARGIVAINVRAAEILRQIDALRRGSQDVFLIDSAGRPLALNNGAASHPGPNPAVAFREWLVSFGERRDAPGADGDANVARLAAVGVSPNLGRRLLSGREGAVIEPGLSGRVIAFAPILPRGMPGEEFWVLAGAFPKSEVLASLRSFQLLVLALGGGVFLLAIIAGVSAARHFTRPIHALAAGTDALARGEFNQVIDVRTHDEIGDLARQFGEMAYQLRCQQQALSEAREHAERKAREIQALYGIVSEMLGLLSLPQLLQLVVEKTRDLLGADLAFLSLEGPDGTLRLEAVAGDEGACLGREVGASIADLCCADMACRHQTCALLPAGRYRSHEAADLRAGDRTLGYLCVAYRRPRAVSRDALSVLRGLADQSAVAIDKAKLHEEVRALERLEERERIAADLHDGIIQSLYATGLGLEEAARLASGPPSEVQPQIERAIIRLNEVIRDVRNYIAGLQPERLQARGLSRALTELGQELEANALLGVELDIDPAVDAALGPEATSHLFHITREALTNVLKHAGEPRARVRLTLCGDQVRLEVRDQGVGFVPGESRESGRGLRNVADRARRLGGHARLVSTPAAGTVLTVDIPVEGRR